MISYFAFYALLCFALYISHKTKYKSNEAIHILTLAFLVCFAGLRYEVGGDWHSYLKNFELYKNGEETAIKDVGFLVLMHISALFGSYGYLVLNLSCIAVFFGFVVLAAERLDLHLESRIFLYVLLFPMGVILLAMGFMRQGVASSILTYALVCYLQRAYWRSIFAWFGAVLFHKSALLGLLVPFVLTLMGGISLLVPVLTTVCLISILLLFIFRTAGQDYINNTYHSSGFLFRYLFLCLMGFLSSLYSFRIKWSKSLWLACLAAAVGVGVQYSFSTLGDRLQFYVLIPLVMWTASVGSKLTGEVRSRFYVVHSFLGLMYLLIWFNLSAKAKEFWVPYAIWSFF